MSGAGRRIVARTAFGALAWLGAFASAQAQVALTVSATSEYRFRGVSEADGRPALQLALEGDAPAGGYAGASATQVAISRDHRYVEIGAYGGRVFGDASDAWRLELGAKGSHFAGDSTYDYVEVYAGVVGERWNARAYASPDYFGRGARSLYIEVNADRPIGGDMRVFGHAGAIAARGGPPGIGGSRARADVRIGAALARGSADLQIAWVAATRGGPYPAVFDTHRSAFVATAAFSF